MADQYDVIVIGGGFAGVTAARELKHRGHSVVIVEARDRLGGRTWVAPFSGVQVEMGGTWVHWLQPHVWAEMRRYGLGVVESPRAARCGWIADGVLKEVSSDQYYPLVDDAINRYCYDAREVFDRPYEPLMRAETVAAIDSQSIRDRLESIDLPTEIKDLLDGEWSSVGHAPNSEAGLSVALRWFALSGWDARLMQDAAGRFKFAQGTVSLIDAMVADASPEILLSSPVAAIEQRSELATVTIRNGRRLTCRAVVMTAPLNTWRAIEFTPALSAGKREAAAVGQASRGNKIWIRVRGEMEAFSGSAPDTHAINWLGTEYSIPGGTILVGFGAEADKLDITDRAAVEAAVREFLPRVDVEEVGGHDWVADEFSRGTWPVFRPGQLSTYLQDLQRDEGRVFMAGSEVANGWSGFIDGAIETGLSAGRRVSRYLQSAGR